MKRDLFLATAAPARPLLADPELGRRWDDPSALESMTAGGLAAHLTRAVTTVVRYLEAGAPPGAERGEARAELLDAAGYFASIEGLVGDDLSTPLHAGIRARAEEEARPGQDGVLTAWDDAASRLRERLGEETPDRAVAVLGGRMMLLDEYLVTRIVELVVHTDDLAVTLGRPTPEFREEAWRAVEDCLVEVARRRHGHLGVVRALARRERDPVDALRVL